MENGRKCYDADCSKEGAPKDALQCINSMISLSF